MAEQETGPVTNGSGDSGTDGNGGQPQISILAQYVKDLSVENPSAPQVFQWQDQPQPRRPVQHPGRSIRRRRPRSRRSRSTSRRAPRQGVHFVVDLSYGGLFGLRNVPEEALGPFLLIEAPRLLFPFARQIVAEAVATPASRRCCSTRSTSAPPIWRSSRRPRKRPAMPRATRVRRTRRRPTRRPTPDDPSAARPMNLHQGDRHDRRADAGQPGARLRPRNGLRAA